MRLAVRLRLLILVTLCMGMLVGTGLLDAPSSYTRAAPNDPIEFSLRQLGYTDQLITGAQPSVDYYFPDPGTQPGPSQMTFVFSHSPLLLPEFSLVSVEVNSISVYGARLNDSNVERTRVVINIPSERFVPGPNRVSARFELRLREECDGDSSSARSAIVYNDTSLRYGPPTTIPAPDLRDFPAQFGSQTRPDAIINDPLTSLRGSPTVAVPLGVATPTDATPAERSAAGTVMLALGAGRPTLPVEPRAVFLNDALAGAGTQNLIMVGRGASIPADALRDAPLRVVNGVWQQGNAAIANDAGVLLMVTPPNDPRGRILIVSGNNDDGITKAATLLNTVNTGSFLTGQGAIITSVMPPPTAPTGQTRYTLQDLGISGTAATVTGFGTHDINASFIVPGIINDVATIQIDFASAPTLEPRLSTVTALINDQPFVTQLLDGKNGERRLLTGTVPANFFRPGRNTLRFNFAMQGLAAVTCRTEISGPAQYATLFPGTNLVLPGVSRDLANLSLNQYPFPFATGNEPLNAVVGDARDRDALSTVYRIALNAGNGTPRGLQTRILTAQEATGTALRGQNAVVVGFPGGNASLDQTGNGLFFATEGGQLRLRDAGIAGVTTVGGVPGANMNMGMGVGAAAAAPQAAAATGAAGTTGAGVGMMPGGGVPGTMAPQFSGSGTGPIGVLQLLPAPWDNTRIALVVAGSNQDHRSLAADALTRGRFTSREAVITKDAQGTLTIGEGRAVNTPTTLASVVAVIPTSAVVGQIIVGTPPANMGASTGAGTAVAPSPGATLAPGLGTAISGGGISALPTSPTGGTPGAGTARPVGTGTTPAGTSGASGAAAPGGTTIAAVGGISLATLPAGTAAPNILTPPASGLGTMATVATTLIAGTPAVPVGSGAGVGTTGGTVAPGALIPPVVVGGVATGTRPPGSTPVALVSTPAAGNTVTAGTPAAAVSTITGVTSVAGVAGVATRPVGTGAASPSAGPSVLGNAATQTAGGVSTVGSVSPTDGTIFGFPRTYVFAVIAAVVLALGIVVIGLVLQGQRRAS